MVCYWWELQSMVGGGIILAGVTARDGGGGICNASVRS